LLSLSAKYSKTPVQIAMNWVICKGAIPIPTPKNREQLDDVCGCLGWKLTQEDEERLDVLGVENGYDWHTLKHFQNWIWEWG
jgi:pyridoxine 4-dehydrogenase